MFAVVLSAPLYKQVFACFGGPLVPCPLLLLWESWILRIVFVVGTAARHLPNAIGTPVRGGQGGLFLGSLTERREGSEKDHIRETIKDVSYGVEDRLNDKIQAAMHEQFERLEGIQKLLEGLPGDFPRQASDDH